MNVTFFPKLDPAARIFLGCLLLLILAIPFDEGGNGYIAQAYTQTPLLVCALIWGIRALRQGSIRFSFDPLDGVVGTALLWLFVNAFLSPARYAAFLELIKICSYAALYLLCRQLFPLRKLRTLLLLTIFGSSVLHMAVGWGWFIGKQRPFLQADFVNPNNFACFLAFGVNIALNFLLFGSSQDSPQFLKRHAVFLRAIVGIFLCGLLWTIVEEGSRGAALGIAGSGFFLCALKKRRLAVIFLALCCFALFLPVSGSSIFERLQKRSDAYAYERFGIWKSSLDVALDHPLTGAGLGQFEYAVKAYNFPVEHTVARYGKRINSAHNDTLQIFAEQGLPGLGLFLGGLGLILFYAFRHFRQQPLCWTSVAPLAVLLGFLIHSLFANLLVSPALAFIVTLACVLILETNPSRPPKVFTFRAPKLSMLLVALTAVYLFLYGIAYPLLGHLHYLQYSRIMREKDTQRAISHLQSAIGYVPIHPLYHYKLGSMYLNRFKTTPDFELFSKAEEALALAVHYNSRNYKYYETRASLYSELFYSLSRKTEVAEQALHEYELALRYNPFSPFLLFSKAMIHADIGQFDRALALLRQAVEIEPNFVGGHQMLGKMLTHLGRETEAERAFQQADEIRLKYAALVSDSHYVYTLLRPLEQSRVAE